MMACFVLNNEGRKHIRLLSCNSTELLWNSITSESSFVRSYGFALTPVLLRKLALM